jgi:CDP-diglyceride synthetase
VKTKTGTNGMTAAALAVLAVAAAFAGRLVLFLFAAAVAVVAAGESFRLVRARGVKPAALVGLAGIVALFAVAHVRGERATGTMPWVLALVVGCAFVVMLARRPRSDVTRALAYTIFTVILVGSLGAYVLAVRAAGFRLLLVLLFMVIAAEAVHGLGRHTVQSWARGFAAAFAGTLVIGIFAAIAFRPQFTWMRGIVLAVLVAAVSPLGARAVEMLERDVVAEPGVRRARAVVLRSVDGVLVSAPVFYYAFRVLAR